MYGPFSDVWIAFRCMDHPYIGAPMYGPPMYGQRSDVWIRLYAPYKLLENNQVRISLKIKNIQQARMAQLAAMYKGLCLSRSNNTYP